MQLVALKQKLGVPLQAEKKRVAGMFDCLDDAIGRGCAGDQCWPNAFHRLVMGAVHLHAGAFDDASEQRAGCDVDAMSDVDGRCRLSMLQHIGNLGRNILVEGSTESDVHRLHAAADGQGRKVVAGGQADKIQFEARPSGGDDRKGVPLPFSVECRIQVRTAACQEQPVDCPEEAATCRTISHKGQNERHSAEFFDGADIPSPEKIGGLFAAPFLTITGIEVGRDSDDGFHTIGSVPRATAGALEGYSPQPPAWVRSRRHRGSGSVYPPSNDPV